MGEAEDPDYEGKRLLELYAAQISAALRPCLSPEAEPALAAAGCAATSRYLLAIASSANGHVVDPVAVRKLLSLLLKLASPAELAAVSFPAYSESSATMVRAAVLQASAQLLEAATAPSAPYAELVKQLAPSLGGLRDCWLALLRDVALLDTQPKSERRAYRPYLYAPAVARAAHQQLLGAWPAVLSAAVAIVPTAAWATGREGAISSLEDSLPSPSGEAGGELRKLTARPAAEDVALLTGLCAHRVSGFVEAGGAVTLEERDETMLSLASLQKLLPHAALPPASVLGLVELLRAATSCAAGSEDIASAIATLVEALCAAASGFVNPPAATPAEVASLLPALAALAAAPLLRCLPHLQTVSAAAMQTSSAPPPAPPAGSVPLLVTSLRATAALPIAISTPSTRLAHTPAALLLAVHTAHVAATHGIEPLATASVEAMRTILGSLPTSGADAASASLVARACIATVLALLASTPAHSHGTLVSALLAAVGSLPADEAEADAEQVHAAVASLLKGGVAEQRVALDALQAEVQRCAGAPLPPTVIGHLRALLPEVATLLLRETPLAAADKHAALKLMLLACAVAPPDALQPVLSLALPLIINCLSLASEAPLTAAQRELSTLAHSSLTALAKRSAAEFRTVCAAFSPETRSRMETALREQAAATAAPTQACGTASSGGGSTPTAGPPKIALKMDFSSFGKK